MERSRLANTSTYLELCDVIAGAGTSFTPLTTIKNVNQMNYLLNYEQYLLEARISSPV